MLLYDKALDLIETKLSGDQASLTSRRVNPAISDAFNFYITPLLQS